ncbi:MAG: chemotaxis protein CheW [Cyanobacteria bacterium J06626_18]
MTQRTLTRAQNRQLSDTLLELIVFQLRQHWFCLPLSMACQVFPQRSLQKNSTDMQFIQLGDETIPVVDTAKLVYGRLSQLPKPLAVPDFLPPLLTSIQSILVVDHPCGRTLGLAIDGIPVIKRVKASGLSPISMTYLTIHRLQGISSVIELAHADPNRYAYPLFVLEMEMLLPL